MNKKLIAILTLVMFAMTLLPMGAFAVSKTPVTLGAIPNITSTTQTVTFPSVQIDLDGATNLATGDVIVFTLPSTLKWDAATAATAVASGTTAGGVQPASFSIATAGTTNFKVNIVSDRILELEAENNAAATGKIVFNLGALRIDSVGTGDAVLNIMAPGTAIAGGDLVISRFPGASVDVTALSTPSRTYGNAQEFGDIRLVEGAAGSLENGKTMSFKLPSELKWNTAYYAAAGKDITGSRSLVASGATISSDGRTLTYSIVNAGGESIINIPTRVDVTSSARLGDVTVSMSGELSGSVVIGKVAEYGVTVSAETAKEFAAGRDDREFAKVTIKETIKDSLVGGRTVVFDLPVGTRFASGTTLTLTNKSGGKAQTGGVSLTNSGRTATFTLDTTSGTTELYLDGQKIDVAANYSGDVALKVSGTAGAAGEVVIAKVRKPLVVESTQSDILLGVQNQPMGDIFVTETAKETLPSGKKLELSLDNGVVFAATPKVEVVEGDITIDDVTRTDGKITITIDSESFVASKIKITDIKVTANRTVPEGDIKLTVAGDAVVRNAAEAQTVFNSKNVGSFKVATVVTPAADNVVKPVVMTVGSTVYTIDGVEMTMDVAPYIKDARTYFPVRYVAQALGITADNVVWDGAQRTVTIFRANRIVQVTIGSTTMLVNGVPLTMDVAPEITAERTMLPIRFVAQGLGVNVNWDAATQTVTLN